MVKRLSLVIDKMLATRLLKLTVKVYIELLYFDFLQGPAFIV